MGVNRRLGVVAWVAATVLSVAASTAAVASVREQVTDRPDLVSLAALRRAAADAPGQPSQTPAFSTTTSTEPQSTVTEPEPVTTTTRPEVEAVPDTVVEESSPPPAVHVETQTTTTSEPERKTDRGRPDGGVPVQETKEFPGGSVTVTWDGRSLELVEAVPADGYRFEIEEQSERTIAIRFSAPDRRSATFVATVNGGRINTRVIR